jgi:hypothetical protein
MCIRGLYYVLIDRGGGRWVGRLGEQLEVQVQVQASPWRLREGRARRKEQKQKADRRTAKEATGDGRMQAQAKERHRI